MRAFVCRSCSADNAFLETVRKGLPGIAVESVDCMSGCTRPQTMAFRAPGKVAYLFGDLTAADLPDLRVFARHYAVSSDGTFADARILGDLRNKAIGRIPG